MTRKLKQYRIQDIYSNIYNYTCYTKKDALQCFDVENSKEIFGALLEVITKLFNCPNCGRPMIFTGDEDYNNELYDHWDCEDCSHIIVLDFRGK